MRNFAVFTLCAVPFYTHAQTSNLTRAQAQAIQQSPAIIAQPNLLNETRYYDRLNAGNLTPQAYTPQTPSSNAAQFKFDLKGYVFGIRMISANYTGWFDSNRYVAYADLRTSGLGALLKKLEIWAVSSGNYNTTSGLQPDFHVQQNLDKKSRRVEMRYDNAAKSVAVNIAPPLGSQGLPPASPQERYSAHDTISAIMRIMLQRKYSGNDICNTIIPVFDSKQHYNIRLDRVGERRVKFNNQKSDTIRCHAYYEPVSGFDPEDLPNSEEAATPVNVYFHYDAGLGLYVPVRFTYKISAITAVIKVTDLEIISSPTYRIVSDE